MNKPVRKLRPVTKLATKDTYPLRVRREGMCYTRRSYGRGFQYFDEGGKQIKDKEQLARIRKLVIPPMWKQVEICKYANGYLQATGRDLKGRKQYIYHTEWEKKRQAKKFAKLAKFGKKLPALRAFCMDALNAEQWTKDKVLSLMVLVLDETGIRIGNQQYADRNGTYGLSTLRRKHLEVAGNELLFTYRGKSKQDREVNITDPDLTRFIKQAAEQPGYEIFRYQDEDGQWQSVDSEELNAFLHHHLGKKFSSKDFRTWVASRLALELHVEALEVINKHPQRKLSATLVRLVADELGNTPSVCRNYYLHPKILPALKKGKLPVLSAIPATENGALNAAEKALLKLIK